MVKQSDENPFKTFIKGYWELPTDKPDLFLSFLRGAILSVLISIIFGYRSLAELLIWAFIVGLIWAAIDKFVWNRYVNKKKGE